MEAAAMAVATEAVKVVGAVAALPAALAGPQAEAHPRFRPDKRCRLKAVSPAVAERRDTLRVIRCNQKVA